MRVGTPQGARRGDSDTPTPPGVLSRSSSLIRQALSLPYRSCLAFCEKNRVAILNEYREIWGRLLSQQRSRTLSLRSVASDDEAGNNPMSAAPRLEPSRRLPLPPPESLPPKSLKIREPRRKGIYCKSLSENGCCDLDGLPRVMFSNLSCAGLLYWPEHL